MNDMNENKIREVVLKRYGEIAEQAGPGCGCGTGCCGSAPDFVDIDAISGTLGYSKEELQNVPEGANMGLGCGNPQAIADLKPGETVLDLGCGGGFDCFLAGRSVGATGRIIGVDMTPEMIGRARENARKAGTQNVEFRLGEIEHLPVADNSVDVIMSNCVVNLSPNKPDVFQDAFRVLRPGGRLAISDIVATAELPGKVKNDLELIAGCVAGAEKIENLTGLLNEIGFVEVSVLPKQESRDFIMKWFPESGLENYITSADIRAVKPM